MEVSAVPLLAGLLIFIASLVSIRAGISVAIIEMMLGVIAGNYFSLQPEPWILYIAGFGGILLTFLAGAEVDWFNLRTRWKASAAIGGISFALPAVAGFLLARFVFAWSWNASLLAGVAISANSIAVVYSVLTETGLGRTGIGKIIMNATFVTNACTAVALSVIFLKPTLPALVFFVASPVLMWIAWRVAPALFAHPLFGNRIVESEIKFVFLVLLGLVYLADIAGTQAILPAFVLGLLFAPHFSRPDGAEVKKKLKVVAYAIVTPFFFLLAGWRVSLESLSKAFWAFAALLFVKQTTKFIGAFAAAGKYLRHGKTYVSLLMSTGLTFGAIAATFGLQYGYFDTSQFTLVLSVEIASAIIPTVVAQKWFKPVHSEDVINGNGS